jgi:hypothetical protein
MTSGGTVRLSLSVFHRSSEVLSGADGRRLLHQHIATSVQMPDDVVCRGVGHELISLVNALPTAEPEREGDALSDIAGVGGG